MPTAVKTGDHDMGLPFGFYSHTTVLTVHEKCPAFLADPSPKFRGQTDFCSHSDPPGRLGIAI